MRAEGNLSSAQRVDRITLGSESSTGKLFEKFDQVFARGFHFASSAFIDFRLGSWEC
jgi:hypothetical protein